MKSISLKVIFPIFFLVFFSVFLSSCGKEHDLISEYVVKETKPKASIFKNNALDTAITQEAISTPLKKTTP